jgi:hypothetical protein
MENFIYGLPRVLTFDRTGSNQPSCYNDRLPQCPATTTLPSGRIKSQSCSEGTTVFCSEVRPRDSQVAGGIADTDLAEVDYCSKPTVSQK